MKFLLITFFYAFVFTFSRNSLASGCYSTHLEGTISSFGQIPLYSSSLLAASSFILKTEGDANNDNKNKRDAANAGFLASGIYFYIALHGVCKVVNKEKYDKLIAEREKLLKEGKELRDLPSNLRFINPVPSLEEYQDMIAVWKRRQRFLQLFVAGLDTAFLYEQARQADRDGTKYFSYASMATILMMTAMDIDRVWGNSTPRWVNFKIITTKIDSTFAPMVNADFKF